MFWEADTTDYTDYTLLRRLVGPILSDDGTFHTLTDYTLGTFQEVELACFVGVFYKIRYELLKKEELKSVKSSTFFVKQ